MCAVQGGMYYKPDGGSLHTLIKDAFRGSEPIDFDAAFLASRCLSGNEDLGRAVGLLEQHDVGEAWWPDASLKLSKEDTLEVGSLLLAHPLLLQSTLTRSMVLVCEHDDNGNVGLVLNRPTNVTLNEALGTQPEKMTNALKETLEVFGENHLWRGGDVSEKLGVLHTHGHLPRSKEVSQGVFWQCDLAQAARIVRAGKAKASDFKLFRGYCGWGEKQLKEEIDDNMWFTTEGPAVSSFSMAGANGAMAGARMPNEEDDGIAHAQRHWGAALTSLGGEYGAMRVIPEDKLRWADNLWSTNAAAHLLKNLLDGSEEAEWEE